MIHIFKNFSYNVKSKSILGYTNDDIQKIRNIILNQEVVVLKSVLSKKIIRDIKEKTFNFFQKHSPSNPIINENVSNFYRVDNNPPKSVVKRVKQFFASFYWNGAISEEQNCMKAMSILRNQIANLPTDYTVNGIESDGFMTYPNITHYPIGGGKLNKHTDPPNKQFTVLLASLSERGKDFKTGGLYIEKNGISIDMDEHLQEGDIYLMNPKNIHGVSEIDFDENIEPAWNSMKGRWVMFPALIEIKTTRGEKVQGLKDLEN